MKLRPPRDDNKFLRNTSMIEVGQVFTIEPGIYVIDGVARAAQARRARRACSIGSSIDELRPFGGIRIEDNVARASERALAI